MNFKKLLVTALAFSLALMCLAGCGGKKDSIAAGAEVTYNGDDIYPVKCDDTLTYWMTLDSGVSETVENFADTPLAKKLEENTGIKVEYQHPMQGQGDEQFQLLLAGNNLPDIVTYDWGSYPGGPQAAIDQDYILNLNDIIDKWAPNLKKYLSEHPDIDRQIKDDEGNYYAFPFLMEEGKLQVYYGPMWRGDWLEKAGLDTPETIDEWENALTVFKKKFGAEAPLTGSWGSLLLIESAYGAWPDFYIDNGKVKYGFYEPAYKETLKKLNEWYDKGLVDSDLAVADSKAISSQMTTGKSGALFGFAGSDLGTYLRANENDPEYTLVGSRYPVKTKGETPEYTLLSNPVGMFVSVAISSNCKNPELAARYLDYGFSEEGHNLYNFGIEGESYTWEDGYPKYTDTIMKNPEGLSVSAAMGRYIRASYSGPFVQDTRYIEQYYQMPQQKEAQEKWSVSNMSEHLYPPITVANDVSDADADIMTNVRSYIEEMSLKFITGEENIDDFDKYLSQLESFGIKDALKNRQDAYDRFLKR